VTMARISTWSFLTSFSESLFNTCFVKKSSLGKNLCYSFFFLSSILTKSFSRDLLLVIVFKRRSSWLQTLDTRDQHSLGSLQEAWFVSWLITGQKRPMSFGFIARSGYNFLVVITRHKGPTFLGVHCKKWE